ncbi:hypothetical protein AGMMS49938_16200 [Fibrobacterales bacterium]|nr:hypothetical protein AGMMS49938_16200 [Fibrobacterales bacterium]
MSISDEATRNAWADHSRTFSDFRFVYPVISRRAKGLSIGVNCTPNKTCNFNCIYCQVDRESLKIPPKPLSSNTEFLETTANPHKTNPFTVRPCRSVGSDDLLTSSSEPIIDRTSPVDCKFPSVNDIILELRELLSLYHKDKLAEHFYGVPEQNRILKDIALSGDGEPTIYPHFAELCEELLKIQDECPDNPKLTLITNATQISPDNKKVFRGLEFLTAKNGEIWGKLDAGTPEQLLLINGFADLSLIENNLKFAASKFPLKIQTMLCKAKGKIPSEKELQSYAEIVSRIYNGGNFEMGHLLEVQLYSVVRKTADSSVQPLPREFLEHLKEILNDKIPNLPVEIF